MNRLFLTCALSALALAATVVNADALTPQDYMEIEQLYARYNVAIDTGDAEGYADTFTPEGSFNGMAGREALVKFIKETWLGRMNGAARRHWNTNLVIKGDSKAATGSVYLMLLDVSAKPTAIVGTSTYADQLVKTPQGWRFTKRVVTRDSAPAPTVSPAPAPAPK